MKTTDYIELEDEYGAHNYHPLDVVIARAEGAWVYDVDGKRYLDCLAAYSAVNQGHCHPAILKAMLDQARKVTLTSRAFRNDQLPLLYKELHDLTGFDAALPMNSGRRGGRDRGEGRAQVGLQGQGHSRRQGRDHRLREQLPRPDDHHHQLLDRRPVPGRLRAVHARLQGRPLRRRQGGHRRHHAEHLRLPGRADPGRGRDRGAAVRLPPGDLGGLPPEQRPVHGRRDPVGARPHGQAVHLHARGDPARPGDHRQGAVGRVLPGVGRARVEGDSRRVQAGRPRQHVRRQPPGLRHRARVAAGAGRREDGRELGRRSGPTSWSGCARLGARR